MPSLCRQAVSIDTNLCLACRSEAGPEDCFYGVAEPHLVIAQSWPPQNESYMYVYGNFYNRFCIALIALSHVLNAHVHDLRVEAAGWRYCCGDKAEPWRKRWCS